MTRLEISSRPELRDADDAVIDDAVAYADPMVLRGLLYQLTGDPEVAATGLKPVRRGLAEGFAPARVSSGWDVRHWALALAARSNMRVDELVKL